jgi:hypothetical protein
MTTAARTQSTGKVKLRRTGWAAFWSGRTFRYGLRRLHQGLSGGSSRAHRDDHQALGLPADTPGTAQLKSLESEAFSVRNLRD